MQVFTILAVMVVSAVAKGSGPYLPSGWRPTGPAFFLPNEVQEPADNLQDVILGSEASGSDALREYGPPKLEISVNQGLPDVAIEQNFVDAVVGDEVASVVVGRLDEAAENADVQQTTEAQVNVQVLYDSAAPLEDSERSVNSEILAEINEESTAIPTQVAEVEVSTPTQAVEVEEKSAPVQVEGELLADIVATTQEAESTTDALDVSSELKLEEIRNLETIVPGVLANLENAARTEIEINQQVADSSSQETSGPSEAVPEGFLEYGPPGFKEYGPPKEDLNVVAIQGLLGQAGVETNEARRRRFSPKFKPVKKN